MRRVPYSFGIAVLLLLVLFSISLAQTTPTAPVKVAATVLKDANLRAGPGTTYAKVGSVKAGATVQIVGSNPAKAWYQLDDGKWIAAFLVKPVTAVPVLQITGTLTATRSTTVTLPSPTTLTATPTAPTPPPTTIAQPTPTLEPAATATPVPAAESGNTGNSQPFVCNGGCSEPPDPSCNIKGNINSKGVHIYHKPGMRDYDKTDIDPGKGERWFCTDEEAVAAGWRIAQR